MSTGTGDLFSIDFIIFPFASNTLNPKCVADDMECGQIPSCRKQNRSIDGDGIKLSAPCRWKMLHVRDPLSVYLCLEWIYSQNSP